MALQGRNSQIVKSFFSSTEPSHLRPVHKDIYKSNEKLS